MTSEIGQRIALGLPVRTARLRLRALLASDLDAFLAYRSREDVAALQGWSPMSRDQARDFLQRDAGSDALRVDGWWQIGIARAQDDVLIGDIGIHVDAALQTAEFGISVHPDEQGLGLGCEAVRELIEQLFRATPVAQVIAVADARNTPCLRMLAKAGMTLATTHAAEFKGAPCIEHVYAVERQALLEAAPRSVSL